MGFSPNEGDLTEPLGLAVPLGLAEPLGQDDDDGGTLDERTIVGEGLRVSLACPQCDEIGWVEWKNLGRGMGCRRCGCRFQIGRDGHLCSQRQNRLRYVCPRCAHRGALPFAQAVRGVECIACNLQLIRGPDNRFYGPEEWAHARQAAAKPKPVAVPGHAADRLRPRGRRRIAAGFILLVLAMGAVLGRSLLGSSSPHAMVGRFSQACLAGDRSGASAFLEDDAVEQAEFTRWRIRYFASIERRFRPPGDKVAVDLTVLDEQPNRLTVEVKMTSPFFGERRHVQCWRQRGTSWRFAVAETLAQQDRAASRSERGL